jgi:hypothetical protein
MGASQQTAARTWVLLSVVFLALTSVVLGLDLALPDPWGGLASRQPWLVAVLLLLINSLGLLLAAVWFVHLLHSQQIPQKLGRSARASWRDFLYWTVGDLKECTTPVKTAVFDRRFAGH